MWPPHKVSKPIFKAWTCPKEKARQTLSHFLSPSLRSNTGSIPLFSILQKQVTKAGPGPRGGDLDPTLWGRSKKAQAHFTTRDERKKKKQQKREGPEGRRRKHTWEGRQEFCVLGMLFPGCISELIAPFRSNGICVLLSPWVSLQDGSCSDLVPEPGSLFGQTHGDPYQLEAFLLDRSLVTKQHLMERVMNFHLFS